MQQTADFLIEGMSCAACVRGVGNVLSRLPGVQVEQVEVGRAAVSFDDSLTSPAAIAAALAGAGYPAQLHTKQAV